MSNRGDTMESKGPPPAPEPERPHREAEYEALREEILRRIELQYQLLNLALIIAGTLLTVSLGGGALADDARSNSHRLLLLVCPPVEMFLALAWAAHNVQIAKAGIYIKYTFEVGGAPGWETYWPQHKGLGRWRKRAVRHLFTGGLPAGCVFISMQGLTLLLSYPVVSTGQPWATWYILDVLMPFFTAGCIRASNVRPQIEKAEEAELKDKAEAKIEAGPTRSAG